MPSPAPLDDPAYDPLHPPVGGRIPDVVERFGPATQVRWFTRFGRELGILRYEVWDRYYVDTVVHRGLCCRLCPAADGCCRCATAPTPG